MNIMEEEGCLLDKRKRFTSMTEGLGMDTDTVITEGMDTTDRIKKNKKASENSMLLL